MARRGALGAAAVLLLAGCGLFRKDIAESVTEAVLDVPKVRSAELETSSSAGFARGVRGEVAMDASGSDLPDVFDEVMRAVVTTIHGAGDREADGSRRVGGITGRGSDSSTLTPVDLLPELPPDKIPADGVPASAFYERYGLS